MTWLKWLIGKVPLLGRLLVGDLDRREDAEPSIIIKVENSSEVHIHCSTPERSKPRRRRSRSIPARMSGDGQLQAQDRVSGGGKPDA
jgi:hypothetical protein